MLRRARHTGLRAAFTRVFELMPKHTNFFFVSERRLFRKSFTRSKRDKG